jgi:hypothetical protein
MSKLGRPPRAANTSRWAVDYSARSRYRPPPRWYSRAQALAPAILRTGWAPDYAVVLEVPGRVSGKARRIALVAVVHDGHRYLVSLAGESQWVRNVRANNGHAVLTRRRAPQRVLLEAVPVDERAPVLLAYVRRGGPIHSAGRARAQEVRNYFGLTGSPTLLEFQDIAPHYPVFEVHEDPDPPGPDPVGEATPRPNASG